MKTLIIAEAGVNHNGSMSMAKELIDVAANAGADFVKFQTFSAENLVTEYARKAKYQLKMTNEDESQFNMLKKLELDLAAHKELIKYCTGKNINFLSSPFDIESIDMLYELEMPIFKIPSGEITNLPYLRHIGSLNKPIIMSTGMATLNEVKDSLSVLVDVGLKKKDIIIMHCNTEYPTPLKDVNLNAMLTIQNELNIRVGYSDHTLGIEVPIAAVALGAVAIEKHFTLDRSLLGPDHAASLEPDELNAMVTSIRNIEKAMGDGVKKPSSSETKNIPSARKSIVAKTTIKKGELFTEENLTVKRPGSGISPLEWDNVITKVANHDFEMDDLIR